MTKAEIVCVSQPSRKLRHLGIMTANDLVAYTARVSNPSNQLNTMSAPKLVKYLIDNAHWSPLEMVSLTIEIETTRDIARQILRHRSFSFQEFCVSEDALITTVTKSGKTKKVAIKDLWKRQQSKQYSSMSDWLVRVFDEQSKTFVTRKIKEVFETGIKPVYRVTLENGKTIEATNQHKLLTSNGFKRIEELDISCDFIGCNGLPLHQSKQWLQEAKIKSIELGLGQSYVAEIAGVKPVTIGKWMRKFGIQYTKREVAQYTKVWNKGLPKNQQPRFNKPHSIETRVKMMHKAKKGEDGNLFSSGKYTSNSITWRKRVAAVCRGHLLGLLVKQNFKCAITNVDIDLESAEVDHIMPVYSHPELAYDINNLQALSHSAHIEKTKRENIECKYTARYSKIASIEYVGERQTYDIEVDHESHNYIANGIITHNSQRYADPTQDLGFVIREARLQDAKNRQNSIETDDEQLQITWNMKQQQLIHESKLAYKWAIENGIAKEQARAVLPEGNTVSKLYAAGTLRSWYHYCKLRMGHGTQKEHMMVAKECWGLIVEEFPILMEI